MSSTPTLKIVALALFAMLFLGVSFVLSMATGGPALFIVLLVILLILLYAGLRNMR